MCRAGTTGVVAANGNLYTIKYPFCNLSILNGFSCHLINGAIHGKIIVTGCGNRVRFTHFATSIHPVMVAKSRSGSSNRTYALFVNDMVSIDHYVLFTDGQSCNFFVVGHSTFVVH